MNKFEGVDDATLEGRANVLRSRMSFLTEERRRIQRDADAECEVLQKEWVELYDSQERKDMDREIERRKLAAERAKGIQRCNFCGGLKDKPRTKSDDSYSVFTRSAPFHRR